MAVHASYTKKTFYNKKRMTSPVWYDVWGAKAFKVPVSNFLHDSLSHSERRKLRHHIQEVCPTVAC
jgi:hypothetical protein